MNKKLFLKAFVNTFLASIYIFIVSQIMSNGGKWFGNNKLLAPFAVLMLFSLSAAVVGSLVFGPAVMLFFENKKKDSIKAASYSIGWFAIYTVVILFVLFLNK